MQRIYLFSRAPDGALLLFHMGDCYTLTYKRTFNPICFLRQQEFNQYKFCGESDSEEASSVGIADSLEIGYVITA